MRILELCLYSYRYRRDVLYITVQYKTAKHSIAYSLAMKSWQDATKETITNKLKLQRDKMQWKSS